MSLLKVSASAIAIAAVSAGAAMARDQITIVGSSTVFPYTQAVAEEFANQGGASPVVESTGTGGGFQAFCAGVGVDFPDITGASRAIRASEWELCQTNGVTDISEALIGYDGLSIAISRANETDWDLTLTEVYMALAARVPVDGALVDNPFTTWDQINPALPAIAITVYGPPPTSGTRDAFVELAMHAGCEETDFAKALAETASEEDYDKFVEEDCSRMRQDGPFIEAGENDNLIVQRLEADANAMGIFGYSFLYENLDRLKDVKLNGVESNIDTIADGSYPVSRPLYIYIKNAHRQVIPGMNDFIAVYMSPDATGADGFLEERGLVALPDAEQAAMADAVIAATPMSAPQ
jgi:phosphate transport system substrate-binding protein